MKFRVYEYEKCDTCRKALKFLESEKVEFERIPIVERPPTAAELKLMLSHLEERGQDFRKLFNTSGQLYRELGIGEKLKAGMTKAEAIALLARNGKLIKRPFLIGGEIGLVGFKAEEWKTALR